MDLCLVSFRLCSMFLGATMLFFFSFVCFFGGSGEKETL